MGALIGAIGDAVTTGLGIQQANKNRRWQRENLKNSVQWRVADLRKAGINPIMAANMGLGTGGSPSGAMPQIANFGQAGDRSTTGSKVRSENRLRVQQEKQVGAATSELQARKIVAVNQAEKLLQETRTSASSESQIRAQTTQIELGLIQAQRRHDIYADPYWGPKLTLLNEVTNSASGALPAGAIGAGAGVLLGKSRASGNLQGAPHANDTGPTRRGGRNKKNRRSGGRKKMVGIHSDGTPGRVLTYQEKFGGSQ